MCAGPPHLPCFHTCPVSPPVWAPTSLPTCPQALRVNGLEQLCNNLASERLQLLSVQMLLAQEEEECQRELLPWVPIAQPPRESCLDLLVGQPHSLLSILDAQTWLSQATDHTFLQKCHYHHGDHPCYAKPQLPLPIFTIRHYAGTVTYQVHKFLNRNRDDLDPAVVEMLAQSQLQLVGSLFQEAEPQAGGGQGKPTLASRFQQSLEDLLARLGRSHVYFIQCLNPNPGKFPGLFDVGHVAEQLRQAGVLETVCTRSANFPVRVTFQAFLARFRTLGTEGQGELSDREKCGTILSQVLGAESPLCHLGSTQEAVPPAAGGSGTAEHHPTGGPAPALETAETAAWALVWLARRQGLREHIKHGAGPPGDPG